MSASASPLIGGIILGAGESSRFGSENKLLATVDGSPIIGHVATLGVESELDELVAVLGHEASAVAKQVDELPLETTYNPRYADGQSSSLRCGIEFARESGWDAAVVLLGDMPFVSLETVDRLLDTFRSCDGSIVAPRYADRRGNPVLFARAHFEALAAVSGDRGGREILRTAPGTVLVDVDDPGVVRDVDSSGDLPDA